jgi:hypothetical protein
VNVGVVMKANKALKRLNKIEALISKVTERSSASTPHIRELLQDAKAAVIRAKEAVQASSTSSGEAFSANIESHAGTLKTKRKLSAAGRKAISEATKKRWAAKRAAAKKAAPAVAKKVVKKVAAKAVAPRKVAKAHAEK